MTIGEIIANRCALHPKLSRAVTRDRAKAMMLKVGLPPNLINRYYPYEFSGGSASARYRPGGIQPAHYLR